MPRYRYGSRAVGEILQDLGLEEPPRGVRRAKNARARRRQNRNAKLRPEIPAGSTSKAAIHRHQLWESQSGICYACQRPVPFEAATREHVVPRSHGGSNRQDNLVMTCSGCNAARRTDDFEQFVARALRMVQRGTIWPVDGPLGKAAKRKAANQTSEPS